MSGDPFATDVPERSRRPRDSRFAGFVLVAALVAVMWVVEIVDVFAGDLDSAGIRPRDADGLIGVALAPVLHIGFGHLASNTVPFLSWAWRSRSVGSRGLPR